MNPSAEALCWFRRRNLVDTEERGLRSDLSPEAVAYLMVTMALRPDHLPKGAMVYLAIRYFGHCTGNCPEN